MTRYKLVFVLTIVIAACGKVERERDRTTHSASFEKRDSVKVAFRGEFIVHDLDPLYKTVLFVAQEEQQPEIILAGFDGKIRESFSNKEILPDGYAGLLAPLKIEGEDSFSAYGSNGFMTFDFSGKLQSNVSHSKPGLLDGQKWAMGEGMEKLGNRYLHINQGFGNIDQRNTDLNREMRLLVWLDPETGESEPFVQFPKSSIFRGGGSFFKDVWKPVFTVVNDHIYVVFGIEPVIYVYHTSPPYSLVSSTPIDLPEYRRVQGADRESSRLNYFDLSFTSGKILNLKWVEEHFIVAYFPGFDLRDSEEYADGKSSRELITLSREMRRKHPTRMAIIDSLGNLVADFIPEDLDPESMLVRNGELWMQEKANEEVEEDYFRLVRVGLRLSD